MPSRTTSTHRFSVRSSTFRPVAKLTPEEATGVIGASVIFSGEASTVNGEPVEGLTYTWSLQAPAGSGITEVKLEESDGSKVRVDSDVTGTYAVTLTVTYEGVTSEPVTAGAFFSPIIVPAVKRISPPGDFMFSVLSDFWSLVNDREVFPIVWSSYTQAVASDLLRALQIDRAKSIATIQPLFQKRFIKVSPKLEIDYSQVNLVLGNHQSGDSAFTGQLTFVGTGALVSATEFVLSETVSPSAVGTDLTVYTGPNAGTYKIRRVSASGKGFLVSRETPFPDYRATLRTSGADLIAVSSGLLRSLSVDFAAAGVTSGDFLRIVTGSRAGFYKVISVGTAGGLPTDRYIEVDTTISSASGLKFDVFEPVRVSYVRSASSATDTVYIPKDDADLTAYDTLLLTSPEGSIVSDYEILVAARHLVDSAIDKKLRLKTGTLAGRTFTIAGFNAARTGFYVTEPIPAASFPEEVSYEIVLNASIADRLLVLDGKAHGIVKAELIEGLPPVEEGGRGDLWAITLDEASVLPHQEGINWRISSTVEVGQLDDFEDYVLESGDLFALEAYRKDLQKAAILNCTVTGSYKNKFSFELGTDPLISGEAGSLSAENILQISSDLSIPGVTISAVSGDAVYTSSGLEIYSYLSGPKFSSRYYNIPLDAETDVDVDSFFTLNLRPKYVIRNSGIGLDPEGEYADSPIFSIPALHEYLSPETIEQTSDGTYRLVSADGTVTILDSEPTPYVENVSYTISNQVLTFLSGFNPASPAPETLWAPVVLVDNFKYIEDNFGVLVGVTKEDLDSYGTSQLSYRGAVAGLMHSWASGPSLASAEIGAHILLDAPVTETLCQIVSIDPDYLTNRGRITTEDIDYEGNGTAIYRTYLYPNYEDFSVEQFSGLANNPLTGSPYEIGDAVPPFTPLSRSVAVVDRLSEPGWWKKYRSVGGEEELKKYHSWQAEFDLLAIDSRDIPLAADFLMKIRPIYTKPTFVGVLSLQDTVYLDDELFVDGSLFLFDDPAFSRESTHMVDSYNESGVSTRLLDFGSFSTRTLFRGSDLAVDAVDPTLVTSARGGFVSGTTNSDGDQILPFINEYFPDEILIRGQSFVRSGDILFITTGKNRGRYLVDSVVDDHNLRISQYLDSAPRGLDPTTHMRSDANASFHVQRYEDELVDEGAAISSLGGSSNVVVVGTATFWSNGVTADDVLVILSGNNRGVYHIEDLGEYDGVSGAFENEETTLTLRTSLSDPSDLAHPFEIRRRALLENPSFAATDGATTAGQASITSASSPDLALIAKGDSLTPSTGSDTGAVFRVVGVSGNTIYTDLPFTATETSVEFSVSHKLFEQDEADSDYRLESLHPTDELEITLYRPLLLLHSGNFTLSDNATVPGLVCQATDELGTDLTALGTPVQSGDSFEVTAGDSIGVYEITAVATDTVDIAEFFPGVELSTGTLTPETGVSCNIYTPDADFSVAGTSVVSAAVVLEDIGIVPGDFFEDDSGDQYLIISVSGSTLTLAEDTGVTTTMSGRIFRREKP